MREFLIMGPRIKKIALLLLSSCLASAELMAEEAEREEIKQEEPEQKEGETLQLEEIEVIGNKVETGIKTEIHSVSITTAADIEDSTILDLRDVFTRTANIQEDFNIRGIGAFSIAGGSLAASPLVGMYVDGAVQSTFALRNGALELWDVQQVEIYRGAQSINLGRSSLAGGIAVQTKDPTYDWTLDTRTQFASFNTLIASAAGGGPILEDELAFRIAFDYQTTDGFVYNETLKNERANDNGNTLIRGKLLFEPLALPGFSALASASYSKNREGDDLVAIARGSSNIRANPDGSGGLIIDDPISPFEHKIYSNHPGYEDVNSFVTTLDLKYDLNTEWRIHSLSTYTRDSYERQDDTDRRPNTGSTSTHFNSVRKRNNKTRTFTQDIKLHYETERVRAQLGGYYYTRENNDNSLFTRGVISRDASFEANTENWAITGKIDVDIADWLTVFAGARYDNEIMGLNNFQIFTADTADFFFNGDNALCIATFGLDLCPRILVNNIDPETSFNAFLPQAGLTINWNDDLSTSFVWKEGYRPGGVDLKLGEQNEYNAEFTSNYEFAIRSSWFDDRLQLNANFYYTKWKDQQILVTFEESMPGGAGKFDTTRTENAGSSKLYGYEIEIKADPLEGLSIFANFGYSRTKFIDFSTKGTNVAVGLDLAGKEFMRAPRLNASVGGTYRHSSGAFISADYNYKSDQINLISRQDNNFDNERLPERAILNMKLGYEFEYVAIYAYARNLLDEEYITHRNTGPRLRHTVRVGEPRIIGVQLTTSWY